MAKIDEVRQCAADTLQRVVSSEEEFLQFLEQGANLFSYSLTDRLLIYGQKPETTMAASFEDWRDKAGCHVKRGEKGIALFSENGNKVRYVFSDKSVEPDEGGRMPERWRFTAEHGPYVVKSLRQTIKAYEYDGELYDQILILVDAEVMDFSDRIRDSYKRIEEVRTRMESCEDLSYLKDQVGKLREAYENGAYTDGRSMMSVFKTVLGDVKSRATYQRAYGEECSMLIGAEIMARWNDCGLNRY